MNKFANFILLFFRFLVKIPVYIARFYFFLIRIPTKDETKVKRYIIQLVACILIGTGLVFLSLITPYLWLRILFALIIGSCCYGVIFSLIAIIIVIGQKNEERLKNDKSKYHVRISKDDILFWVKNSIEPDEIMIEYNGKRIDIDIMFDFEVKGGFSHHWNNKGDWIDKGLFINHVEYPLNDGIKYLKKELTGNLYITWYTEDNDPKVFKEELKKLKDKLQDKNN